MLFMEFAALHKKNDGGTDNHRAQVPVKQELEHVTRPWQNIRVDRQTSHRHKTGWKQVNNNNELVARLMQFQPNGIINTEAKWES